MFTSWTHIAQSKHTNTHTHNVDENRSDFRSTEQQRMKRRVSDRKSEWVHANRWQFTLRCLPTCVSNRKLHLYFFFRIDRQGVVRASIESKMTIIIFNAIKFTFPFGIPSMHVMGRYTYSHEIVYTFLIPNVSTTVTKRNIFELWHTQKKKSWVSFFLLQKLYFPLKTH